MENINNLLTKIRIHRDQGKKIVFTNGVFDILHVGHIMILEKAKSLGDVLVVGINTDSSVRQIKGPKRPINHQKDRAKIISSLKMVDYVIFFKETTPTKLISKIKPDIHVKGGDYVAEEMDEYKTIVSYGGKIVIIPLLKGKSVSSLVENIILNKPTKT